MTNRFAVQVNEKLRFIDYKKEESMKCRPDSYSNKAKDDIHGDPKKFMILRNIYLKVIKESEHTKIINRTLRESITNFEKNEKLKNDKIKSLKNKVELLENEIALLKQDNTKLSTFKENIHQYLSQLQFVVGLRFLQNSMDNSKSIFQTLACLNMWKGYMYKLIYVQVAISKGRQKNLLSHKRDIATEIDNTTNYNKKSPKRQSSSAKLVTKPLPKVFGIYLCEESSHE